MCKRLERILWGGGRKTLMANENMKKKVQLVINQENSNKNHNQMPFYTDWIGRISQV